MAATPCMGIMPALRRIASTHSSSTQSTESTRSLSPPFRAQSTPVAQLEQAVRTLDALVANGHTHTLAAHLRNAYQCDHVSPTVAVIKTYTLYYAMCQSLCGTLAEQLLERTEHSSREALLLATHNEQLRLVDLLLCYMQHKLWRTTCGVRESCLFEPHITALHLACARNNYNLVQLLLSHGHRIKIPHLVTCKCDSCVNSRLYGETLQSTYERLDSYKAITSKAYIWLVGYDPVNNMIRLMQQLKHCARNEVPFRDQYKQLIRKVDSCAGELAALCWTEEEVKTLLSNDVDTPVTMLSVCEYPRLVLALRNDLKDFVTTPRVQEVMEGEWLGSWDEHTRSLTESVATWACQYVVHAPLYFITSIVYICSLGRYPATNRNPCARFRMFTASYLSLLILLVVRQTWVWDDDFPASLDDRRMCGFYVAYVVYMFGLFVSDLIHLYHMGAKYFFACWWRSFDALNFVACLTGLACLLRALLDENTDGLVASRTEDRINWHSAHPRLIAEILLALSYILTFWRVFYLLQITRLLGPTLISIKACIRATSFYVIVMVISIVSFSYGVSSLLQHYFTTENVDADGKKTDDYLKGWHGTFYLMYEAFYGFLEPHQQEIVVGMVGPPHQLQQNRHWVTQVAVRCYIALFQAIVIIYLLNLKISLLVNHATEIMGRSDSEWKFVRAKIWLEYFDDSVAVPPPFNIVWLPLKLINLARSEHCRVQWPDLCYINRTHDDDYRLKYNKLIKTLFKRHVSTQRIHKS